MRTLRLILVFLFVVIPAALLAEIGTGDLPSASKWYFHADFDEMRTAEAGRHLYAWLQDEVFTEIEEETGVDLDKEAQQVTAFAEADDRLVIIIDGEISQETRDKVLAMGAASGALDKLASGGKDYYYIKEVDTSHDESDEHQEHGRDDIDVDSFDNGAYFSFAIKNKVIVTSTEEAMQALLDNRGRLPKTGGRDGALIVLSADRSLMQAGLSTDEFEDDIGWDSNIIRNTKQLALLISDEAGKIVVEAELITAEKEMAESLASIARGLISLQIFNDDLDPDVSDFLQNTSVDVDGTSLRLRVALDPEVVVAAID